MNQGGYKKRDELISGDVARGVVGYCASDICNQSVCVCEFTHVVLLVKSCSVIYDLIQALLPRTHPLPLPFFLNNFYSIEKSVVAACRPVYAR